jgi:hypothetical protein
MVRLFGVSVPLLQWVKDEARTFIKAVEDSLDSLPEEFRSRIKNVAILVKDFPAEPATTPAGAAKEAASGFLPRRSYDEEGHY